MNIFTHTSGSLKNSRQCDIINNVMALYKYVYDYDYDYDYELLWLWLCNWAGVLVIWWGRR